MLDFYHKSQCGFKKDRGTIDMMDNYGKVCLSSQVYSNGAAIP